MTFSNFYHTTLGDLLSTQAERFGEQIFLRQADRTWTYAQAEQAATQLASGLRALGLEPGDRLAVLLPNLPEYVITLFAAAKAGLLTVPINIRRHPGEIRARLIHTCPKAVVTFSQPAVYWGIDHLAVLCAMKAGMPYLQHVIAVGTKQSGVLAWEDVHQEGEISHPLAVQPSDPAVIEHTLGSSGAPRGAVLTHQGLVRNAADIATILACESQDVFLGAVPFSNTFGMTPTILSCVVAGAQLICLPKFDPVKAQNLIQKHGVTIQHGVPTMFALELNQSKFDPQAYTSMRTGIISGAHCPPELARRVREDMSSDILLAYGLTEASPSVSMTRLDDGPITATETVGRAMPGVEIKAVDEQGQVVPPGEEGELWVRGYNVMSSYFEAPNTTAQVLDSEGWLHTGDLASIDADGQVRILGRIDDIINRAGLKIHPVAVEMVLRAYPGVREAAVVAMPDAIYGALPCACVVPVPGVILDADAILGHAAQHLADYAVPERVLFFKTLPRRPSGTVDRVFLSERVRLRGRVWKFGKNIDTDAIIPARHCNTADPRELATHCMEDADPAFVNKMRRGDLIVAEENFGCGSSREVAPISIKSAGVSAVIAKSFARIFFRNSINIGLPILECPAAVDGIREGDEVEVEPATGLVRNLTRHETYQAVPFPPFLRQIIDRGGLLPYVEDRLAGKVA